MSAILATLGLPLDDASLRQRVTTFVICNGFEGVYRATRVTRKTLDQGRGTDIDDPWAYTVRVYNRDLAKLSYLYSLRHWVEMGLRSQADQHHIMTLGARWHRDPRNYLDGRQPHSFQQEYVKPFTWIPIANETAMLIDEPEMPSMFMDRISLNWLTQIVLNVHKKDARRILVDAQGKKVDFLKAQALLSDAVEIRNAVAHNRFVSNEVFMKGEKDLLDLLRILQFDVEKAVKRTEDERDEFIARIDTSRKKELDDGP